MQGNFLTSVTAVAVSATLGVSTLASAQTAPPMGGGYTNVIPIRSTTRTSRRSPGRYSSRRAQAHSPASFS
jgi:hypothetical protein